MLWTDPDGHAWDVIEWRFVDGKRKRVTPDQLGAQGKAFIPVGEDADTRPTLIYQYTERFDYRDFSEKMLRSQFARAVLPGSTGLEQLRRKGLDA